MLGSNAAMLNTDKAWQKWGRDDPYFGVLADPRFAAAQIAASREEFFATGDIFISGLLAKLEHHFGPVARGRALDHGCGVGRLSLPLAAAFRDVVALDVAPAMLDEARANVERAKGAMRTCMAEHETQLSDGCKAALAERAAARAKEKG